MAPRKATAAVPQAASKSTCKWLRADDNVLIDTLTEERNSHPGTSNGWKATSWTACVDALAGSEAATSSKVKDAAACKQRFNKVCCDILYCVNGAPN